MLAGELKRDLPVIRRERGISGIDRAPGELSGGVLVAGKRLGLSSVEENITVPWGLGDGIVDFHVRADHVAELGQDKPTGGAGGRPFRQRYPIQVEHGLTGLAEVREDLAARAQRYRVPAVQRQDPRKDRDRGTTIAEPPQSEGEVGLDDGIAWHPVSHAREAYERAWGDGPPHCDYWALRDTRALLQAMRVPEPQLRITDPATISVPLENAIRAFIAAMEVHKSNDEASHGIGLA
jgi:hypothetical protein